MLVRAHDDEALSKSRTLGWLKHCEECHEFVNTNYGSIWSDRQQSLLPPCFEETEGRYAAQTARAVGKKILVFTPRQCICPDCDLG